MKLIWCRLWYSPASKKVHRLYRLATESCNGAPQSCYNANSGTALPATVCIYDRLLTESCHGALQSCYHANPGTDLLAKRYACITNCWPSRVTVKVATMQTLVQTCSWKNKKALQIVHWVLSWCSTKLLRCKLQYRPASKKTTTMDALQTADWVLWWCFHKVTMMQRLVQTC